MELTGKQVTAMQCVGKCCVSTEKGCLIWLGEVVREGFLEEWAPKLVPTGRVGVSQVKKEGARGKVWRERPTQKPQVAMVHRAFSAPGNFQVVGAVAEGVGAERWDQGGQ